MRSFEVVKTEHRKLNVSELKMPVRATNNSAGYDFFNNERDVVLTPGMKFLFWTDIKCKLQNSEVLFLFIRSSLAIKHNLELVNKVGVIDSDYYSNIDNDGNIGICIKNCGSSDVIIKKGDRISQGVIMNYLITSDDKPLAIRTGGIGSTN